MDHRARHTEYPLEERSLAKQAFQDLLVEAYRERETLLRGRLRLLRAPDERLGDGADHLLALDTVPRRDAAGAETYRLKPHPLNVGSLPTEEDARPANTLRDQFQSKLRLAAGAWNIGLPHGTERRSLGPDIATGLKLVGSATSKLGAVAARNVVEAFAPTREKEADHDVALQRLWRQGLAFIAVFGGAATFWMIATTMSSAVIGPGQFVVDGSVKKVQHPTGGVVSQLLVREGDQVSQGDLLIRRDETVTRANFQVIVGQLDELAGRKARLEAEREEAEVIEIPSQLSNRLSDPEVSRIVAAEQKLFEARRSARQSQRGQLAKRIDQYRNEIIGLRSQLEANSRETEIITEELKGVRELYAKQLTSIMRLSSLERQAAGLTGQKGQLTASIAQTEGKIAEIGQQITQIGEDLRAETQRELREVQGKIAELSERRAAAHDLLTRVELRAPSSGTVHQLAVHTVGGVITAAEPAMLIVPTNEELIVETRVMPQDRDQLQLGQNVVVRVHSSNRRTTPELYGTLTRIAADVSKDQTTAAPYYSVWVAIGRAELARLHGVRVSAGMQAEVFIEAGSRSPLSYLLRPLTDQVSRAFKER
jgi:HlyD family secretion protein